MEFSIREGRREDIPAALQLIRELAEFEQAPEQVSVTEEQLENDGFGENPLFRFFVAESDDAILAIALYYYRYSTWKGKTLFLEDIVVQQDLRGHGIGQELFNRVIARASEEKCYRMSWQVLDWNEKAIVFYEKYGASLDGGWLNCDLFVEDLERLGHEMERING